MSAPSERPDWASRLRSGFAWWLFSVIMFWMVPAGAIVFALTAPFDPGRDRLRRFIATWASTYAWLTPLYRFQVIGREHLPQGAHVLVANHESTLDILCLMVLRTSARFLAEDWILRVPPTGAMLRWCRHIPVKVGDRESGRRALREVEAALREGSPVAVFPEGQLSPDELGPFRPGAFVAAQRAGVPVVPLVVDGAGRAWRRGTLVVRGRHRIRLILLEPIPAEVVARTEPAELASVVRERILRAKTPPGQPIPGGSAKSARP